MEELSNDGVNNAKERRASIQSHTSVDLLPLAELPRDEPSQDGIPAALDPLVADDEEPSTSMQVVSETEVTSRNSPRPAPLNPSADSSSPPGQGGTTGKDISSTQAPQSAPIADPTEMEMLEENQGDGDEGGAQVLSDIVAKLKENEDDGRKLRDSDSPLSDLPDLPDDLDITSPPDSRVDSATVESVSSLISRPTVAESSTTAAKRSRPAKRQLEKDVEVPGDNKYARQCKGKKSMKMYDSDRDEYDELDASSEEELQSLSSITQKAKPPPKQRRKREPKTAETRVKNRKQLDGLLGIKEHEKRPERTSSNRPGALTEAILKKALLGKTKERQMATCLNPRYSKWGKCTQCVAKVGGDSCRFRDFRTFPIDPKTVQIIGGGYFEDTEMKDEMTPLPNDFNNPPNLDTVARTERTVASILLPVLLNELRHIIKHNAIRREVDSAKHRSVCDFCSSTVFAGYWFCRKCGRDICLQCERYFSDGEETMDQSPWPLRIEARFRLLRCIPTPPAQNDPSINKKSTTAFHFRPDLQPVSRFSAEQLKIHCTALMDIVFQGKETLEEKIRILGIADNQEVVDALKGYITSGTTDTLMNGPASKLSVEEVQQLYTKMSRPNVEQPPDPAELMEQSHSFMRIEVDKLNNAAFEQLWSRGEPILVEDVGKRLQLEWTPDEIIEKFGQEACAIVDCQTNISVGSTVGKFFEEFKKPAEERSKKIYKLKDWPTTEDFKQTHPGLYNDFSDALPVPDYTRREGVLNLYSHFPPGPTKPDIGPKMYNAFTAIETAKGFGSTRLHMDIADAINLMLYASPRPDGQPGCAVWDLFRAEDADTIRHFLHNKFGEKFSFNDPIHAQLFYLDSALRMELWEKHQVSSFRIYQYPGQAVFIPAGCAHQVCNLSDCIKIALDFVSPHNVTRCQKLTSDFRNENFVKVWKEDVLQLYNVLWYAWLSSRDIRERIHITEKEEKARDEARVERLTSLANGDDPDTNTQEIAVGRWWSANLSANLSSVRDQGSPTIRTLGDAETSEPNVEGDKSKEDVPAEIPAQEMTDKLDQDVVKDAIKQKILQNAIDSADPSPPVPPKTSNATKWPNRMSGVIKTARPKPESARSSNRPERAKMSSLIKEGRYPVDLAVEWVKATMGEGAPNDDQAEGGNADIEMNGTIQEGAEEEINMLPNNW